MIYADDTVHEMVQKISKERERGGLNIKSKKTWFLGKETAQLPIADNKIRPL